MKQAADAGKTKGSERMRKMGRKAETASRGAMSRRVVSYALALALAASVAPGASLTALAEGEAGSPGAAASSLGEARGTDGAPSTLPSSSSAETESGTRGLDMLSKTVNVGDSADGTAVGVDMVSTSVDLSSVSPAAAPTITFACSGLCYRVNEGDPATASFVGWSGNAPEGELAIPEEVMLKGETLKVTSIGIAPATDSTEPAARVAADIAVADKVTSISLPTSVSSIDATVFAAFPNAAAITVAEPEESEEPEDAEGSEELEGGDPTTYTSKGGIVYTSDMKTLVVAPAGMGASVTIPAECTEVAEAAFFGNSRLATIVPMGYVQTIATRVLAEDGTTLSFPAFEDDSIANATVLLAEGDDREARQAVWEGAGFTHFTKPISSEETLRPADDCSGFVYTMLPDFTLAIGWQGEEGPGANLQVPASGTVGGVRYTVSTIAAQGFADLDVIETVDFPDSITTIGDAAFAGCANLKGAAFGASLATIGERAFEGTALVSAVLSAGLKTVGSAAFGGLDGTTIVALDDVPNVSPAALHGSVGVSVYVPYSETETYVWNAGLPAQGNRILPYGVKLGADVYEVKVGQTVGLYDNGGYLFAPDAVHPKYSYLGEYLRVDAEAGQMEVLKAGSSSIKVKLTMQIEEVKSTGTIIHEISLV